LTVTVHTPYSPFVALDKRTLAVAAVVGLALLGVLADIAIKAASQAPRPLLSRWLAVGATGYAFTALGWVFVLRHLNLATVGAIYCVVTMLLLAVAGAVIFRETLRTSEIAGLALAVASIWLLRRFG
jgi:multidrug transporter EmrE-like cation transporter